MVIQVKKGEMEPTMEGEDDLIRVGEEALMESTQPLILLSPFSASNLFMNSILRSAGEKDLVTGGNKVLKPSDFTSTATTFC